MEHPRECPLAQQLASLGALLDQRGERRHDHAAQLAVWRRARGMGGDLAHEKLGLVLDGKAAERGAAAKKGVDGCWQFALWLVSVREDILGEREANPAEMLAKLVILVVLIVGAFVSGLEIGKAIIRR